MSNDNRVFRGPQESDERVLVPTERVITRNAGCWNCKFMRDATEFWFGDKTKGTFGRRGEDLNRAVTIAVDSPRGENDQRVLNIRRMIVVLDEGVSTRAMVRCGGGYNETDLIANSFMCHRYVGATGASVAREGERINDLPEDVREKIDGSDSSTAKLDELAASIKGDES